MSDPLPPRHDKTYLSIEKDEREGNKHICVQSTSYYGESEKDDAIHIVISMEKRDDGHLTDWVEMNVTAQEARLLSAALNLIADNADWLEASKPDQGERETA